MSEEILELKRRIAVLENQMQLVSRWISQAGDLSGEMQKSLETIEAGLRLVMESIDKTE